MDSHLALLLNPEAFHDLAYLQDGESSTYSDKFRRETKVFVYGKIQELKLVTLAVYNYVSVYIMTVLNKDQSTSTAVVNSAVFSWTSIENSAWMMFDI